MRRSAPLTGARLAGALVLLVLVAGCGDSRTDPPDVTTPSPPVGTAPAAFPTDGVSFDAPGGWAVERGQPPLVATVHDGTATIAIWRYPRTERLPRSRGDLSDAAKALAGAAKTRDPSFQLLKTSTPKVAGRPAVQLRGRETIAGQARLVRSTHVYADGAEVVVDAYADPAHFGQVDEQAFLPLLRSLRLAAPRGGA